MTSGVEIFSPHISTFLISPTTNQFFILHILAVQCKAIVLFVVFAVYGGLLQAPATYGVARVDCGWLTQTVYIHCLLFTILYSASSIISPPQVAADLPRLML